MQTTSDTSLESLYQLGDFEAETVKCHSPGSESTIPVSSDNESSPSQTSQSEASTSSFQPPRLKRQKAVYFDVLALLEKTARGKSIIENVRRDKMLSPPNRRILVSLCVANLMQEYGDRPSSFHKEALAQAITAAFPCLKDSRGRGHEAFYHKGTTGRSASGWLEEHLKYTRRRLKKCEGTGQKKASLSNEKDIDAAMGKDPVSDEEGSMMRVWLMHNNEPRSKIEDYMRKTVYKRAKLVHSDGFGEAISQYPKILAPGMIEQDFQLLYPEAAEKLYQKWPKLHQTVTVYAEKNFPNWKEQLPWNCSLLDEEERAFLSLPYVFQSRHKRRKGVGSASLTTSIKSFIDINPNLTSIDEFCQSIVKEDRPQPFILVLWDEKQKTRQFFTVFERRCLLSTSLLKAVDTCFKLHFVLDVNYQVDCFASWQFLQHIVFELFNDKVPELNCVRAFRAYYNSM